MELPLGFRVSGLSALAESPIKIGFTSGKSVILGPSRARIFMRGYNEVITPNNAGIHMGG